MSDRLRVIALPDGRIAVDIDGLPHEACNQIGDDLVGVLEILGLRPVGERTERLPKIPVFEVEPPLTLKTRGRG